MSVILTKAHDYYSSTGKACCNQCGHKVYPPFLEWHGETNFWLCKACVIGCKRGLQADLIHLSAIAEMHKLYDGARLTLDRCSAEAVEEREREPELMGAMLIRKLKT